MPESLERVLDAKAGLLKAMAHPVRLRILELLQDDEECVCILAGRLGISQPNLSQHLAILRQAGLVRARKEGSRSLYSSGGAAVRAFSASVAQLLDQVLAAGTETLDDLRAAHPVSGKGEKA